MSDRFSNGSADEKLARSKHGFRYVSQSISKEITSPETMPQKMWPPAHCGYVMVPTTSLGLMVTVCKCGATGKKNYDSISWLHSPCPRFLGGISTLEKDVLGFQGKCSWGPSRLTQGME